jgi:hypothetical protein
MLRPKGRILFAEPRAHVSKKAFEGSLSTAKRKGFTIADRLKIRSVGAVLPERPINTHDIQ